MCQKCPVIMLTTQWTENALLQTQEMWQENFIESTALTPNEQMAITIMLGINFHHVFKIIPVFKIVKWCHNLVLAYEVTRYVRFSSLKYGMVKTDKTVKIS